MSLQFSLANLLIKEIRNYWKVLKGRLTKNGNETGTFCNRLKLFTAVNQQLKY
jgi:hypothetical protein